LTRRVLVTGGAGGVAGRLVRTAPVDVELHVTEHRTPVPTAVRAAAAAVHPVDLRREREVRTLIAGIRPDVVVHTAYVQSERDAVVLATGHVAGAAGEAGAALVHLSTDVVFAGDRPPYAEDAPPDPISDYGRWKVEAERLSVAAVPDVCTTRTSLVVSLEPPDRATGALVAALRSGREVTLFDDEMRQPIRGEDLAAELWALVDLDRGERAGVWHLPGPDRMSRLELGLRLAARLGLDAGGIRAASSASFPTPRARDTQLAGERRRRLDIPLRAVDA
jgi:dTDP-4-dehydrorhamnose reductase